MKVRRAFCAAVAEHGMETILTSARRWAEVREPQYLPEPVKWLAGGWRTDPPPERGGTRKGTGGKVNPVDEMLNAGGFRRLS